MNSTITSLGLSKSFTSIALESAVDVSFFRCIQDQPNVDFSRRVVRLENRHLRC